MTNREYLNTLTAEERASVEETYRNHVLYDYIAWDLFWNSENGNEMEFVKCLEVRPYRDRTIYILCHEEIDGILYERIFDGEEIILRPLD